MTQPKHIQITVAFIIVAALLTLLAFGLQTANGQDTTPEPTAPPIVVTNIPPVTEPSPIIPPDSVTPDTAGQLLISALLAIVGTYVGSPLTTAIVGLLKRFIPDGEHGGVSGQALSAGVAAVLWVLYNLAAHFNYGATFASVGSFLVLVLADFGPLIGSLLGAPAVYAFAAKHQVVVLGFQRGNSIQTVAAVQKVHQG